MLKAKGRINKQGEIVLQCGHKLSSKANANRDAPKSSANIKIELSVSIDLNDLISGVDGFVWATKNYSQAEIICNAIKVQNVELEIIKAEFENTIFHLIRIVNGKDIESVIDFIQKDKSGLRLKPDWNYPEGNVNLSFDQWIND